MPSRIIRDGIIESKAVNALTEEAEVFYRRLMSVVDDFGRYEADADLLLVKCFPRQLDRWSTKRVQKVLREVSVTANDNGVPLVLVYRHGNRDYLEISNFNQRLRSKTAKCPEPTARQAVEAIRLADVSEVRADDGASRADDGHVSGTCGQHANQHFPSLRISSLSPEEVNKEVIPFKPRSGNLPSQRFEEWFTQVWAPFKGTARRIEASVAWFEIVTAENEDAVFECTASYLASLTDRNRGFRPDNFIYEHAKDEFRARYPPAKTRDPTPRTKQQELADDWSRA